MFKPFFINFNNLLTFQTHTLTPHFKIHFVDTFTNKIIINNVKKILLSFFYYHEFLFKCSWVQNKANNNKKTLILSNSEWVNARLMNILQLALKLSHKKVFHTSTHKIAVNDESIYKIYSPSHNQCFDYNTGRFSVLIDRNRFVETSQQLDGRSGRYGRVLVVFGQCFLCFYDPNHDR